MKNKFKSTLIISLIAIIFTTLNQGCISSSGSEREKEIADSVEVKTIQSFPMRVLRGYEVTSWDTIEKFGQQPSSYRGIAINCDGIGECDSIVFISRWAPKLGNARFEPIFSSNIYHEKWNLIKQ